MQLALSVAAVFHCRCSRENLLVGGQGNVDGKNEAAAWVQITAVSYKVSKSTWCR